MSAIVRFSPELRTWILHNLEQGCAPTALVNEMERQKMAPEAARAIVQAFVTAQQHGSAVPIDTVTLDDPTPDYQYDTPIFRPGASIGTSDRIVHVAARAERPMLAVLSSVLDRAECEALISLARPRLRPSTIVDPVSGHDIVADHRSSFGMFFRSQENDFIARLDRRMAEVMNMPVEHGEGIQVLYYLPGAQSKPHFDFLVPSNPANQASLARSGQRVSSLVVYLNDVDEGGETVFPSVGWSISPHCGNAVYFEYCNHSGELDHASLHAGNPVLRGEKWVATKWMRQRPFIMAQPAPVADAKKAAAARTE